jgi:hypothetical protein
MKSIDRRLQRLKGQMKVFEIQESSLLNDMYNLIKYCVKKNEELEKEIMKIKLGY